MKVSSGTIGSKPLNFIFVSSGRKRLAKLVLDRVMNTIGDYLDNTALAYDGTSDEYVSELNGIADFDVVIKSGASYGVGERLPVVNAAYDMLPDGYYFHLQNDYYLERPDVIPAAVNYLEEPSETADFVRMEKRKHAKKAENWTTINGIPIGELHTGIFRFNWNPHIRETRFPFNRDFYDLYEKVAHKISEKEKANFFEREFDKMWIENGYTSAVVDVDGFRHIGLYQDGGRPEYSYLDRFFCRPDDEIDKENFGPADAVDEFYDFAENKRHAELFEQFVAARNSGYDH